MRRLAAHGRRRVIFPNELSQTWGNSERRDRGSCSFAKLHRPVAESTRRIAIYFAAGLVIARVSASVPLRLPLYANKPSPWYRMRLPTCLTVLCPLRANPAFSAAFPSASWPLLQTPRQRQDQPLSIRALHLLLRRSLCVRVKRRSDE